MTTNRSPTRNELVAVIDDLIEGSRSRQDVAKWAQQLYFDDDLDHSELVADALESLGAADLVGGDRPYLFTEADFNKWKAALIANDNETE